MHYNILNKSENATLQNFIICEKAFDKKYLLKLNGVSQTSSKRFVEIPLICLFRYPSYVLFCVLSLIHQILSLRMRKKRLLCLSELVILVLHKNTRK